MSFVHLHCHSHYSILEGLPKPKDYVKKAKELGMEALALTDTGNLHGCHEFYKACKAEGINPIFGTEIFVESSLDEKINHKLVLLAKNGEGYRNIILLVSKASLDNPGAKPKIKFEDIVELKKQKKDLEIVCLSGPITGEIPYYILSGKSDEQILDRINQYIDIFGEQNYFLELLYHEDIPKQKLVTDKLIEISSKYNISVVATQNSYYLNKEDKKSQDVIMALGTGHEIENPDRPTLTNGDYSFLSEEEMQTQFGFLPEALENTKKIADMVNIEIKTGGVLIPTFELPEEHNKIFEKAIKIESKENIKKLSSDEWYLRYLSFIGLNWRYDYNIEEDIIFKLVEKLDKPSLDKELTETSPEELKALSLIYYSDEKKEILSDFSQDLQDKIERLEYELVVVNEMGFNAYFLIVADYINWARDNDIPVGPGRGSAAGSLMAYLSGITDIDPLEYDLLFERFLNPARISMPDIDTDFADTERDKVIKYCSEKYGSDKVVNISTFGTFAARAAVKDVGRVFGIPFSEMNELVKLIPEKPGTKLAGALEDSVEFAEAYESNKIYKEIIDNALKIEGNVRQLGVHACAVIIAPESMTNFTALQHPPKDDEVVVTQYNAGPLEDLGLLKMDFLGLRNLTIIKRTQKIIEANTGKKVDVLDLDMTDPKIFEVFATGDTTGIFQFESDGMRKYLKDLKPDTFEDLIAMVSLYRPGPIAYIPTFIDVKYGRQELKYLTDDLKEILEKAGYTKNEIAEEKRKLDEDLAKILDVSYGIAVYQEQLMFIVQYMAGFSLGEADLLRRGVGKKKLDVVEALKKEFIQKGAKFRNYKPETTNYIYTEMIMPAANYSFNKSHAACYAFIAYQTAFLKAYYPTEFLTSMMVSDEENMERIVLEVSECETKGISVLPSSVNESLKHFTYIDNENIRFGLKAIKGIGDGPIDRIIEARKEVGGKFENLEQFVEICGKEVINKKSLESLILAGAMDDLGERNQMFSSIIEMIKFCRKDEKKKETNQIGLFDNSEDYEEILELQEVEEMTVEQKLAGEKEMIGFWVSGHPLDGLSRFCIKYSRNINKLKMDFEELLELDKKENPEKYEDLSEVSAIEDEKKQKKQLKKDRKQENAQAIGVIVDLRKIITKTGKNMVFLKCEGYDYDFEIVIFPKDVEGYIDKLELDKIIIINGNLDINFEYKRKTIQFREQRDKKSLIILGIQQAREHAKDLGLFLEGEKRFKNMSLNEEISNKNSNDCEDSCSVIKENFDENLDKKIENNKTNPLSGVLSPLQEKVEQNNNLKEYIVDIPKNIKKQDLVLLKEFLLKQDSGKIEIFINLKGQKITTKISINNIKNLEKWILDNY